MNSKSFSKLDENFFGTFIPWRLAVSYFLTPYWLELHDRLALSYSGYKAEASLSMLVQQNWRKVSVMLRPWVLPNLVFETSATSLYSPTIHWSHQRDLRSPISNTNRVHRYLCVGGMWRLRFQIMSSEGIYTPVVSSKTVGLWVAIDVASLLLLLLWRSGSHRLPNGYQPFALLTVSYTTMLENYSWTGSSGAGSGLAARDASA